MPTTILNRKILCFGSFHIIQAVSSFSAQKATPLRSPPAFIASKMSAASEEDPYLWLEEVESDESLSFAKKSNGEHDTTSLGVADRPS